MWATGEMFEPCGVAWCESANKQKYREDCLQVELLTTALSRPAHTSGGGGGMKKVQPHSLASVKSSRDWCKKKKKKSRVRRHISEKQNILIGMSNIPIFRITYLKMSV